MELLHDVLYGFEVALRWQALVFCLIGVSFGMLVGVLPGIGALAAIAMLLPLTFHVPPTEALIMLAGIYYGVLYGASTASILLNLPGTPSAAVTCLDGYPMARQGRAGVALLMTAVASFFGGCFSIIVLILFAPPLARFALSFGAPEYFSMMLLGLVAASTLSEGSPVKGIAMVVLGLILGVVGTDGDTGHWRFTFGQLQLLDGLNLVAIAIGLLGVAEVMAKAGESAPARVQARSITWRSLLPTRQDVRQSIAPMVRGSGIGAFFGALPGTGVAIASFMAYAVEKRVAKEPQRFGKGAIEGVVAPEAANNSGAQAAFIPTMTLGIPGDPVMVLMLGALMIHGIPPGPQILIEHRDLFWGLVASFWIGNLILLVLNIPLIQIWVRILTIPYRMLYPSVLLFACIGVYSVRNSVFDVAALIVAGLVGYAMMLLRFPAAPVLLGFILGPLVEGNMRRALRISAGDLTIFVTRPLSATFLALTVALLVFMVYVDMRRRVRHRRAMASERPPTAPAR